MSWPRRLTAFVLYAAIMLAIGWALKQVVGPFDTWVVGQVGDVGAWAILIALLLSGAVYLLYDSARRRRLRGPHG